MSLSPPRVAFLCLLAWCCRLAHSEYAARDVALLALAPGIEEPWGVKDGRQGAVDEGEDEIPLEEPPRLAVFRSAQVDGEPNQG